MTSAAGTLPDQVRSFADDLGLLLHGVFDEVPNVEIVQVGENYLVRPEGQTNKKGGVPLRIHGEHLATLRLHYRGHLDSRQMWMAILSSEEWVVAEVHAHREALSHLLSQAAMPNPHDMSEVRLPTGGA